MEQRTVHYKDFGAVGDGYTDDMAAIIKAHEYANSVGAEVKADEGATYYIGASEEYAVIKTSVDWTGATFIIDDSKIGLGDKAKDTPIFVIEPSIEPLDLSISTVSKGAARIDVKPGVPCLIYIEDGKMRRFKRFGPNANSGEIQREVILVDSEGNIDPKAPPIFDYPDITTSIFIPTNEEPLTVKGGDFITVANVTFPKRWVAFERGIRIKRSNTTVTGIKHTVEGDNKFRCAYHGFIVAELSNNVLIENCVFTAHLRTYFTNASGEQVLIGSYETGAKDCNSITWRGCTQTNFFNSDGSINQAGMMGTNRLKNVSYIDNFVGSFDAHTGLHNLYMKGCTIKGMGIQGSGLAVLEDVHMYKVYAMHLKCDYGSGWDGDFVFKNVTLEDPEGGERYHLFRTQWVNHDFGYKVTMPRTVTIENLKLPEGCYITYLRKVFDNHADVSGEVLSDGTKNENPVTPTEKITVIYTDEKTDFRLNEGELLKNTSLIFEKK